MVEDGGANIFHQVNVGVPHLGQEPKGQRGEKAVDGELEACLEVATVVVDITGPRGDHFSAVHLQPKSPRDPRPPAGP